MRSGIFVKNPSNNFHNNLKAGKGGRLCTLKIKDLDQGAFLTSWDAEIRRLAMSYCRLRFDGKTPTDRRTLFNWWLLPALLDFTN